MATTDEIMDYVLNTPNNTNPNVLRDMLNEQSGSGGGVDFFVVNFIPKDGNALQLISDKTTEEIMSAIEAGVAPIAHYTVTMDKSLIGNVWYLIEYFTGVFAVTFNGQRYVNRDGGNVWE